jgi:beta-lactamase class C
MFRTRLYFIVSVLMLMIATTGSVLARSYRNVASINVAGIVDRHIRPVLETPGGAAVAVRINGRTLFFNYGTADAVRPITSNTLFDLASVGKVFDTTLLALSELRGTLSLDDTVGKHVGELQNGNDIRRVTLRELATYTSGLVLAQDHPPWPKSTFTLPQFIAAVESWRADESHEPGRQMIYSHAGFVLIHLALERRFGMPFDQLMKQQLLEPLGLHSTTLPIAASDAGSHPHGEIPSALASRAVQGYSDDGQPTGAPGDLQGYYRWLGTGQMYASARDMAVFLSANLGELHEQATIEQAMRRAQRGVFPISANVDQALAWEVHKGRPGIVDKYGGMNNASAYIGFNQARHVGVVILGNRGNMDVTSAGRKIIVALCARR